MRILRIRIRIRIPNTAFYCIPFFIRLLPTAVLASLISLCRIDFNCCFTATYTAQLFLTLLFHLPRLFYKVIVPFTGRLYLLFFLLLCSFFRVRCFSTCFRFKPAKRIRGSNIRFNTACKSFPMWKQCLGSRSGIRCFIDPWSRSEISISGSTFPDTRSQPRFLRA